MEHLQMGPVPSQLGSPGHQILEVLLSLNPITSLVGKVGQASKIRRGWWNGNVTYYSYSY